MIPLKQFANQNFNYEKRKRYVLHAFFVYLITNLKIQSMKKLLFAIAAVGLLTATSCKKEEKKVENSTENATEKAEETAQTGEEAVGNIDNSANEASDVPKFSSPEVQKFATDYAAYYKELAEATKSADAAKIQALQAKGTELTQKSLEFTKKMTPEDTQKWADWSMKIMNAASGK